MRRWNAAALNSLLVVIAVFASYLIGVGPAQAVQTPQDRVVSDDPVDFTPHVLDGDVLAVAVVGNKVILGGEFTRAQNASGGPVLSRINIVAFNRTTGVIDTGFVPAFDGKIRTLAPGPDGTSVYVGGEFNNVNGVAASKITRLDINTGQKLVNFKPGNVNALVYDAKLVGNRLFIGGQFTKVAGQTRSLLAELDPNTGALRATGAIAFAGVHRGGSTMVYKFDTNPAGTQLTAIGNFMTVNGLPRVQIAQFDITGSLALMADWRTAQYEPNCYSSFQYYIRDIDYSPDGSYFVTSATGGYGSGPPSLCDTIVRWSATERSQAIMPTWVDYSGGDSTYAIEVTGAAIYGGGHTRWFNNPFAADNDGPGAVAREGIEALDPVNGLPLSWDPGRARGRGIFDMVATSDGLWIGSDTDRIGDFEYHGRVAFFPLAGGTLVPQPTPATLPVDAYLANQPAGPSLRTPYRVNAGGGELLSGDTGPAWSADDGGSAYRTGSSNGAGWSPVPAVDATVPATTPSAVFDSERWGSDGANEMEYDFAVPAGDRTTVRLYFANRYGGTSQPGQRVFDVTIDGTTVLDNYDIVADVGNDVGTMKSFDIVSDGTVDIRFGHVVENPLVNGIEIIDNDQPADAPPAPLATRTFSGTTSGATTNTADGGIAWSTVRGGFWLDGKLYLASADGTLTVRSYDGSTFGAPTILNLYLLTQFQNEMAQMTGLFYSKGSIYFTLNGDSNLYRRYFTVESGIVGAQRFTVSTGGVSWNQARGMFLAGDGLYWSAAASGDLHRITWSEAGAVAGTDSVVSGPGIDGTSWKAGALFALPGTVPNIPPTALMLVNCAGTACAFDGTGSTDTDGTIIGYAWAFGDGATSSSSTPSHEYSGAGTYHVTLTVTDNDAAIGSTEQDVVVADAIPVTYVGSARHAQDASKAVQTVVLPPAVIANDQLVMAMSYNSTTATVGDPAGWTRAASTSAAGMTTIVWTRTASAGLGGTTVTVTASLPVRSSLLVSAYRNAVVAPAGVAIGTETVSRTTHTTPSLTAPAGSWLVSVWTDKTAATTAWTAPAGQRVLQTGAATGAGHISWLMTDSNGIVSGAVGGLVATADSATANAGMISVVLAPTG